MKLLAKNKKSFCGCSDSSSSKESCTYRYWDEVLEDSHTFHHDPWRAHLRKTYRRLITNWGISTKTGLTLKTDLYDEAKTAYPIIPLFEQPNAHVVGIDTSPAIVRAAKERMAAKEGYKLDTVICDVRKLCFRANSFDRVISNSTLDHFSCKEDITVSIKELCRILKVQGELFITLDNPFNPIIALRNLLPYSLLRALGIVPYYMGQTLSRRQLIGVLESKGLTVSESAFINHAPRIFMMWLGYIFSKIGSRKIDRFLYKMLRTFEYLQNSIVRSITGYFIAVKAIKR